jgi:hypothetical protein
MFFDLWLLQVAATRFKITFSTSYGVLLSLVYPVYAFLIPLLSLFVTPQWKGRKISVEAVLVAGRGVAFDVIMPLWRGLGLLYLFL